MVTKEELRKYLQIDPDNLTEDCSIQPELFLEAVELATDARVNVKVTKHNLEVIRAGIELDYRQDKIPTDVKKTESSIASLVTCHKDVKEAEERMHKAEREAAMCDALTSAFDQKRSMLNNIVSLYTASYFNTADIKGKTDGKVKVNRDALMKRITDKRIMEGAN